MSFIMKRSLILILSICLFLMVYAYFMADKLHKSDQKSGIESCVYTGISTFDSFEMFEQHERSAGTKAVSCYYIPSSLPSDFALTNITKRDDAYVMITYSAPHSGAASVENLSEYDTERLQTLLCRYSLVHDAEKVLQNSFLDKGYTECTYAGRTYYRWDEHAVNDPEQLRIGYEIAFIQDGALIYLHLPAIDTFEQMMQFAGVQKIEIL